MSNSTPQFLGDRAKSDPRDFVFGFGKRVCSGCEFAEFALFILISNTLGTLRIDCEKGDAVGIPITPKIVDFPSGGVA